MRKWILPGLLALTCGILTNTALAGNAEDCDVLKDKDSDSYAPSLYGLCVAWHNANENAKPGLADKFFDRAGFEVPGSEIPVPDPDPTSDFECPCWAEVSLDEVCALGSPDSIINIGDFTRLKWDYDSILFEAAVTETYSGDMIDPGCAHTIIANDITGERFLYNVYELDPIDAEICLMESKAILEFTMSDDCATVDP